MRNSQTIAMQKVVGSEWLPRNRSGESEMRGGAGRGEAGDVRDAVAFECQHQQRARAADVGVWVFDVLAERGLVVGPRRNETVGVVSSRERIGVKLLDRFTALVLVRLRGHRQPRVLGQ